MTAHAPPDWLLPGSVHTVQVKIHCACGPALRTIPLHMTLDGITFYRTAKAPPDLIVQSWRCPACKHTVKITAAMLYLAA